MRCLSPNIGVTRERGQHKKESAGDLDKKKNPETKIRKIKSKKINTQSKRERKDSQQKKNFQDSVSYNII